MVSERKTAGLHISPQTNVNLISQWELKLRARLPARLFKIIETTLHLMCLRRLKRQRRSLNFHLRRTSSKLCLNHTSQDLSSKINLSERLVLTYLNWTLTSMSSSKKESKKHSFLNNLCQAPTSGIMTVKSVNSNSAWESMAQPLLWCPRSKKKMRIADETQSQGCMTEPTFSITRCLRARLHLGHAKVSHKLSKASAHAPHRYCRLLTSK